ncbi:hypothetical protein Alches_27570 [Alicyclobacillus hesperidum subsp. aegles]|nr:hypothetical protein Alches_27570 [Alicyclobacillus hesperidum subsp. aegles]
MVSKCITAPRFYIDSLAALGNESLKIIVRHGQGKTKWNFQGRYLSSCEGDDRGKREIGQVAGHRRHWHAQ